MTTQVLRHIEADLLVAAARRRVVEDVGPFRAFIDPDTGDPGQSFAVPVRRWNPDAWRGEIAALDTLFARHGRSPRAEVFDRLWPGLGDRLLMAGWSTELRSVVMIRPTGPPVPQAAPPAEAAVASTAPIAPAPPPPAGTALGMNILFEYNSTNVLPESVPYLERLGEVLNLPENQGKVINIIGHTDATGSSAYNQGLSEQRALAVGQYLVDAWHISPDRLGVEGRGEAQPLAGTDPNDGVNRRVEFYALE